VRAEGGLDSISMLREFEPGDRVAARLEISTGRWPRARAVGVDVMGDGSVVAFEGGIHRNVVEPRDGESPFDAVRRVLA
jgi:hypothetical protein